VWLGFNPVRCAQLWKQAIAKLYNTIKPLYDQVIPSDSPSTMQCALCETKKAKRFCQIKNDEICPVCCASTRTSIPCTGCIHFVSPKRNYRELPMYKPPEMDGHAKREAISEVIEEAMATFDFYNGTSMNDWTAIRVIECLLDVYHFQEEHMVEPHPTVEACFQYVFKMMQDKLSQEDTRIIAKILGAIYFVANRRTTGQREYLQIIKQYVGIITDDERIRIRFTEKGDKIYQVRNAGELTQEIMGKISHWESAL
jgi:hypothetical protein